MITPGHTKTRKLLYSILGDFQLLSPGLKLLFCQILKFDYISKTQGEPQAEAIKKKKERKSTNMEGIKIYLCTF